jgi:MFS family permease
MLAYSLLQGTLALFSEHVLGLSSTMNGVIFAYLALVGIVAQMFAFKKILSWMSEKRAVIMAMVAMALGFILITFGLGLWTLIVAITLLGFGYSISGPMIVGWLSKRTADNEQGGTAGLNQSMTSIARLVGPVFGTSMYQHLGFKSPYYVASGILLITAMFQLLRFKPGLWHNVAVRSQDLVNK